MFNAELDLDNFADKNDFPADARIRIIVGGLAFCRLDTKKSEINFLSHVPHHKLDFIIVQRQNGAVKQVSKACRVKKHHTVTLKADDSIAPASIEISGNYPLSDIINISKLHAHGTMALKQHGPDKEPIILTVEDCGFYTYADTTNSFDLIETDGMGTEIFKESKQIGYVLGGNIKCKTGSRGNLTIAINGSSPDEIRFPLEDAGGEFFYDVIFNNHCTKIKECIKDLRTDPSDFRYYYDLLEDPQKPNRKFRLVLHDKAAVDVAACNVVIVEPLNL